AREAVAEAPRNSRRRIERGKRPGLSWRGLRDSPARIRAALGRIRGSLVVVGRVVLVCVICAGAAGLARLVERHVRTSEAFAVREIMITGLERLGRAEIVAVTSLREGQNIFDSAPEELTERLEAHPWIAEAHVRRRLPQT